MYPDYFGKLSNEAILAGNAASAYDELTKAIIRKGQAQAAEDIVADYSKETFSCNVVLMLIQIGQIKIELHTKPL